MEQLLRHLGFDQEPMLRLMKFTFLNQKTRVEVVKKKDKQDQNTTLIQLKTCPTNGGKLNIGLRQLLYFLENMQPATSGRCNFELDSPPKTQRHRVSMKDLFNYSAFSDMSKD